LKTPLRDARIPKKKKFSWNIEKEKPHKTQTKNSLENVVLFLIRVKNKISQRREKKNTGKCVQRNSGILSSTSPSTLTTVAGRQGNKKRSTRGSQDKGKQNQENPLKTTHKYGTKKHK